MRSISLGRDRIRISDWANQLVTRTVKHELVGQAGLVFGSQLLLNALNYVFHFTISRNLGAAGYGTLQSLLAIFSLLSVPSAIVSLVIVKYVAELDSSEERSAIVWMADRLLQVLSVAAIVAFGLLAALSPVLTSYLHIPGAQGILVIALMVASYFVLPTFRSILQGLQDFRSFAISLAVEGVGKAALGVAFVYIGFGVTGAVSGAALASIIALGFTLTRVYRVLPHTRRPFAINYRRLLESGAGAFIAALALAFWTSADMLLVKHFFSAQDAGLYASAALVGRVLLFVVGFLPVVLLPKVTQYATEGRSPRKLLIAGFAVLGIFSGLGLLILVWNPVIILRIMAGRAFVGAAPLLALYGACMALLAGINVATTYKIAVHRFDFAFPLIVAMVGEVVAIQALHNTLFDVLRILIVGHSLALLACLYRITAPVVDVDRFAMEHIPEVS